MDGTPAAPAPDARIPLTDVARELRVPYGRLHRAFTSGAIPGRKAPLSGRIYVDPADLPRIAEACGVAFEAIP